MGASVEQDEEGAGDSAWNGQTQLLLEDRERLERLVAQCSTPKPMASPLLLRTNSRLGQDWQQRCAGLRRFDSFHGGMDLAHSIATAIYVGMSLGCM